MKIRFFTRWIHAYFIDYPVALALIVLPFLLGLGADNPWALRISVASGIAAIVLPVLTDHETGLIRIIPYWLHVMVDRALGLVFLIVPFAFGFKGVDAWYYWVNAAAVLLATLVFNAPEPARSQASAARA
jgi:hypothetical protein